MWVSLPVIILLCIQVFYPSFDFYFLLSEAQDKSYWFTCCDQVVHQLHLVGLYNSVKLSKSVVCHETRLPFRA